MLVFEKITQPQIKQHWYNVLKDTLKSFEAQTSRPNEPYLLIVDVSAGDTALDALQGLPCLQDRGQCYLLVISPMPNALQGLNAVRLGARGYMHAYAHPQRIQQALEAIGNGQAWLSHEVIQAMSQQLAASVKQDDWKKRLTQREVEIVEALMKGLSNREIAEALHISEPTVKTHLKHIFDKFDVKDRLSLVLAIKNYHEQPEENKHA